jgi:hypothetical protein
LKKKNTQHKKCVFLIENLCRNPKDISKRRLYAREIKLAKQLLKKHPDFNFWERMVIDEKPYSLSWFLTLEGVLFLSVAGTKNDIKHKGPKLEELSEEKIGEDRVIKKRPLTILDFLRKDYGKDKGKTK